MLFQIGKHFRPHSPTSWILIPVRTWQARKASKKAATAAKGTQAAPPASAADDVESARLLPPDDMSPQAVAGSPVGDVLVRVLGRKGDSRANSPTKLRAAKASGLSDLAFRDT